MLGTIQSGFSSWRSPAEALGCNTAGLGEALRSLANGESPVQYPLNICFPVKITLNICFPVKITLNIRCFEKLPVRIYVS